MNEDIIDQHPILKDCKGFEKNEFILLNKEHPRQQSRRLDEFWFFRNFTKEYYFTNSEIDYVQINRKYKISK